MSLWKRQKFNRRQCKRVSKYLFKMFIKTSRWDFVTFTWYSLSPATLDNIERCRWNGPDDITRFDALDYARSLLASKYNWKFLSHTFPFYLKKHFNKMHDLQVVSLEQMTSLCRGSSRRSTRRIESEKRSLAVKAKYFDQWVSSGS